MIGYLIFNISFFSLRPQDITTRKGVRILLQPGQRIVSFERKKNKIKKKRIKFTTCTGIRVLYVQLRELRNNTALKHCREYA